MFDNRFYSIDGNAFDMIPIEVSYVNYKGDSDNALYSIIGRSVYSIGSNPVGSIITAKPFDVSIKKLPMIGEIVYVVRGISSNINKGLVSTENYYIYSPISVHSNVSINQLKSISNLRVQGDTSNMTSYEDSEIGYTKTKDKQQSENNEYEHKPEFVSNIDMGFIQPYEGDVIYEGRSGNSIRFSSTSINNNLYSIPQNFQKGVSSPGSPITIIRNGVLPKTSTRFNVENIDDDISSIWMTSGQSLDFINPTTFLDVQSRLETNSYDIENEKNSGNQIGLFSDRIFIVSKNKEVNILSKNGVNISTDSSIALESGEFIELQSTRINLGIDAEQPVLMGNDTVDLLSNLISELKSICNNISKLTVGTGTGPSTTPVNTAAFTQNSANLEKINGKLESLKSELVFLNKS